MAWSISRYYRWPRTPGMCSRRRCGSCKSYILAQNRLPFKCLIGRIPKHLSTTTETHKFDFRQRLIKHGMVLPREGTKERFRELAARLEKKKIARHCCLGLFGWLFINT